MPLMRSPDGSETVEVPQEQVEHYRQMGAMLVRPAGSRGATAAAPVSPVQQEPMPDMAQAVLDPEFEPMYSGAPDEPLEAPPWWLDPVEYPGMLTRAPARLSAAIGGIGARSIARLAPTVPGTIMAGVRGAGEAVGSAVRGVGGKLGSGLEGVAKRWLERRVPGLSTTKDLIETFGKGGAEEASEAVVKGASRAPTTAEKVARREAAGRVPLRDPVTKRWLTQAEREAKGLKPTPKPKAKPKKAELKPKSESKPVKAKPGGVTTKPQRGQSGPALEQRAKMRAKYKAQRQSEGLNPAAQADDLESLLQRSIELEQELGAMGISPMQRALARRTLGQAGGSAAGLAALAQILGVHDDQGGF